jgi:phage gpG-like protein
VRFGVTLKGSTDKIRGEYAAMAERAQNLRPGILRGALVGIATAQGRIRDGGPGWAPTVESSSGSSLYRSGALFRSLTMGAPGNVMEDIPGGIRIGTNLKTPSGYNIGALMQYGTGPITPKNGRFLRFVINGTVVFSRGTKGIPARPFMFWDQPSAQRAAKVVADYAFTGRLS